jgi:hypothetical protein
VDGIQNLKEGEIMYDCAPGGAVYEEEVWRDQ